LRFLLSVKERMSDMAMPEAPKLAWSTVSLGAAVLAKARYAAGAASPAAARRFKTSRRVKFVLIGRAFPSKVPGVSPCVVRGSVSRLVAANKRLDGDRGCG
jgi:hypothetical protein